jgi:hypothetical protein
MIGPTALIATPASMPRLIRVHHSLDDIAGLRISGWVARHD